MENETANERAIRLILELEAFKSRSILTMNDLLKITLELKAEIRQLKLTAKLDKIKHERIVEKLLRATTN